MRTKSSKELTNIRSSEISDVERKFLKALSSPIDAVDIDGEKYSDFEDDWLDISDEKRKRIIENDYERLVQAIDREYDDLIREAEKDEEEWENSLKVEERIRKIVRVIEGRTARGLFQGGRFGSRYARVGGLEFRISNHRQATGGGFSEDTQSRHGCADYSLVVFANDYELEECVDTERSKNIAAGKDALNIFVDKIRMQILSSDDSNIRSNPGVKKTVSVDVVVNHLNETDGTGDEDWVEEISNTVKGHGLKWRLGPIPLSEIENDNSSDDDDLIIGYGQGIQKAPPIVLIPSSNKKYKWYVVDGAHRAATMVLNKFKTIMAYYPDLDALAKEILLETLRR